MALATRTDANMTPWALQNKAPKPSCADLTFELSSVSFNPVKPSRVSTFVIITEFFLNFGHTSIDFDVWKYPRSYVSSHDFMSAPQ